MHDPNTTCPRHTDDRGIKKEKEGGDGGGAAEVSDFFYKEFKSKKTNYLSVGGATRVSEFFLQRIQT